MRQRRFANGNRWAVILAGGDGVRLRSLTRLISGDERPKQFCKLLNGRTLLSQTRRRIQKVIPAERTLLVLTQHHWRYFESELAAEPAASVLVQPSNRGTAPAILYSLLRLAQLDSSAVVAFFPSDHHYTCERRFRRGVREAFEVAEERTDSVVVVGAEADRPETDYGWIETEPGIHTGASLVRGFWEKPAPAVAQDLFQRGGFWNTFIMMGTVGAFLQMVRAALPELYRDFHPVVDADVDADYVQVVDAYSRIETSDFARQVLAKSADRLLMTPLRKAGWSDLGDPFRASEVRLRNRKPTNQAGASSLTTAVAGSLH